MLELYEPFRENSIISLFSTVKIWGLRVKTVFLFQFLVVFPPWIQIQEAKILRIRILRISVHPNAL